MTHGLIFDLDGTLVDSLPGIAASLNRSLISHGLLGHSHAAVGTFVGDGLQMLVQRAAPTGADPQLLASLVAFFKKDYAMSWADGTQPYPGILRMLETLQQSGHPLAVLSNKTHAFTTEMVRLLFPDITFTGVLGQKDGLPHKPAPDGALALAESFGIPPAGCVIIGDSTTDLATASNANMQCIAVTWGYHDRIKLTHAGARIFCDQPESLPGLLDSLRV